MLVLGAVVLSWPRPIPPPVASSAPPSRDGVEVDAPEPQPVEQVVPVPSDLGQGGVFLHDSETSLARFRAALGRANEGQARVVVFGASHEAGDHYVGFVRDALQTRFGDAGHGFAVAAWPSEHDRYWQWGVRVARGDGWKPIRLGKDRTRPDYYGIAGVIFDSEGREAHGEVATSDHGVGQTASIIEVHFLRRPGGGNFEIAIDGAVVETVSTAGRTRSDFVRFEVVDAAHRVQLRALPGRSVRLYGVVLERDAPGVIVDNLALGGTRARHHLKALEPVYSTQLLHRRPDLVVLGYGGNEGNDFGIPIDVYATELHHVVAKLRRLVPEADCLLVGPLDKPLRRTDGSFAHRHRTTSIARVQRDVAQQYGCAYFDTVAFMGGRLSMLDWAAAEPPLARPDFVHLTGAGYHLLGRALVEELAP